MSLVMINLTLDLERAGIPIPPLTGFSKCFEWETFNDVAYNYFSPQLYQDDFIYFDCTHGPLLEQACFDLYCFLCRLNDKGVFWYLSIPVIGNSTIKEFYVHGNFQIEEDFVPNPKGIIYKHLTSTSNTFLCFKWLHSTIELLTL